MQFLQKLIHRNTRFSVLQTLTRTETNQMTETGTHLRFVEFNARTSSKNVLFVRPREGIGSIEQTQKQILNLKRQLSVRIEAPTRALLP